MLQLGSEGATLATGAPPGQAAPAALATSWQQGLQYMDAVPVRNVRPPGARKAFPTVQSIHQ